MSHVIVLTTSAGHDLILRDSPSDDTVREWVRGQNTRYRNMLAGGPSGIPAYYVLEAHAYQSEWTHRRARTRIYSVDIEDLTDLDSLPLIAKPTIWSTLKHRLGMHN